MARGFRQGDGVGLCAVYAVVNALNELFPGMVRRHNVETLVAWLSDYLPDLRAALKSGVARPGLERLLLGARDHAAQGGWPAWSWEPRHPKRGSPSLVWWNNRAAELLLGGRRSALIVGFGDGPQDSRYEPHWTCIASGGIGPRAILLKDSAGYGRVKREETGIRPEPGWQIEDAYLLRREREG
jgi:hypothetical protein